MANKINMNKGNEDKSTNAKSADEQKQEQATQNTEESVENAEETNAKSADEQKQEQATQNTEDEHNGKKQSGKYLLTYLGGSIWADETGAKWARESVDGTAIKSERTYSKKEYNARKDLQFMVDYGEMKLTIV